MRAEKGTHVVDDGEFVRRIGTVRVAVDGGGLTVRGPTGVRDGGGGDVVLLEVDLSGGRLLPEGCYLSDGLVDEEFALLVTVHFQTSGIVSTVFEPRETLEQDLDD